MKKIIKNKFFYFNPSIFLFLVKGQCGKFKLPGADARKFPADPKERVKKNLEEGRGFRFNDAFGGKNKRWKFLILQAQMNYGEHH